MTTPKILGAVAHSPPAPAPVLLIPVMVAQTADQEERWMLQASSGKWRHMTFEDLLCIVRQLSAEDRARLASELPATEDTQEKGTRRD